MQRDRAHPARLARDGQVLDKARHLQALRRRNVLPAHQHRGKRGSGFRVVILVRPRQRHDQAAADVVRQLVHLVDLRRQQQLADIAEHRVRHVAAAGVAGAVDRGGDAAGEEPLDDLYQFHQRIPHMGVAVHVQAVRLHHHRAGADQQVAEAGTRANAAVPVVRRVAGGQETAFLMLAGQEDAVPGDEDVVEHHHAGGLPVFAAELRRRFARPSCRPRHDGDARCVHRHRAAHREVAILGGHGAAGHHQELMHVRRAGHDRLGAAQHDAVRTPLGDVDVDVAVGLRAWAQAAVALGVRHRHAQRQVAVLHLMQVG